jgi:hypothetical protein
MSPIRCQPPFAWRRSCGSPGPLPARSELGTRCGASHCAESCPPAARVSTQTRFDRAHSSQGTGDSGAPSQIGKGRRVRSVVVRG